MDDGGQTTLRERAKRVLVGLLDDGDPRVRLDAVRLALELDAAEHQEQRVRAEQARYHEEITRRYRDDPVPR